MQGRKAAVKCAHEYNNTKSNSHFRPLLQDFPDGIQGEMIILRKGGGIRPFPVLLPYLFVALFIIFPGAGGFAPGFSGLPAGNIEGLPGDILL